MSPDKAQQIGNELMGIAKTLAELADKITEECSKNTPAEEKCLDIAEVRGFLADKSRAGHTEEIQVLLAKHGVKKLSELPKTEYAALMEEARVL